MRILDMEKLLSEGKSWLSEGIPAEDEKGEE